MSRLGFIADVHVGNHSFGGGAVEGGMNARCRAIIDALRQVAQVCQQQRLDALVIAGDLFDTSSPLPQHIAAVQAALADVPRVIVLRGNHDMVSATTGDHALGPLNFSDNVTVVEAPETLRIGEADLVCVPFQTGDARGWFEEAVPAAIETARAAAAPYQRVLAFHLGIVDDTTPGYLSGAHDAVPLGTIREQMKQHGIIAAYGGNWHAAKAWGKVVQISALVPTGFDNPGWDYGLLRTYDTATGMAGQIHITGPRFMAAHTEAEVERARVEAERRGCQLYLSLKGELATSEKLETVRGLDGVTAARAVADTGEVREATRAAAVAVREADTLTAALAAYVKAMPLADGLDREKVLAMAKGYLTRGAA